MKQNLLIPLSLLLVIDCRFCGAYTKRKKEVHLPPHTPTNYPPQQQRVPFVTHVAGLLKHMYNIILLIELALYGFV